MIKSLQITTLITILLRKTPIDCHVIGKVYLGPYGDVSDMDTIITANWISFSQNNTNSSLYREYSTYSQADLLIINLNSLKQHG